MAPPTLQYGLNLPNKKQGPPSLGKPNLAAGQKRKKTIFDSDSEDEGNAKGGAAGNEVEITEIGGLEEAPKPPEPTPKVGEPKKAEEEPPSKRKPLGGNGGKPAPGLKPLKNSIFTDDDEEDTPENQQDSQDNVKSKPNKTRLTGTTKDYANLSVLHSSTKHAKEAQDLDPSIYSYDAIYDSIHSKPSKFSSSGADNGANSGPRYMASLLRSAEIRKRDQLRAREKQLQREREAEGDEFADKEKFVTAAYRAQQEEVRRIEEEEARREKEEEERRRRDGGVGMVGFYRDMLARGEEKHGEAMRMAQEAAERVNAGGVPAAGEAEAEEEEKEKSEAQIAAELNAKGANIVLNDEGQVVDKRQLLSAGLNVPTKPKPKPSAQAPSTAGAGAARPGARPNPASDAHFSRNAQRARQTELIASQLEERARREEEAEAARQREIAERTRSRKTESEVSSARERYLARKREREEAAAKGKG